MMLRIADDPLATLAERATVARPMRPGELARFLTAADRYTGPRLIADRGFNWMASTIGQPFYYRDRAGIWRDTLTDEAFDG
jgi:hypothetical protein